MGAWGVGSFENDDAMDWVTGLREGPGDNILREALAPITSAEDQYLQAPDCSIAIAAAEAVAAGRGHPAGARADEVVDWVRTKPIVLPEMAALARGGGGPDRAGVGAQRTVGRIRH